MNKMIPGIWTTLLLLAVLSAPVAAGPVAITVRGIAAAEGRMFVGLYRPEDDFPRQGREFKGITLIMDALEASTVFADVPDGTYAVAVFHDANSNGEHDRNIFGMPREDYGFSNNARGSFGAPDFEKAAFKHEGQSQITIDLQR